MPMTTSKTSELKLLIGGGIAMVIDALVSQFEQATGHKIHIFTATAPNLIKRIASGEPFDAGVVPSDMMKDAGTRARFAAGPTTDVARVGFGVAVRAGAPKPDLGTADAFKQAMLKAQSISFIPESASGGYVLEVFERLGIGDAMKAKTKVQTSPGAIPGAVASGEAELAVFVNSVLIAPGVEPPIPFPPGLQRDFVFTAALSAAPANAEAAAAFLAALKSPAALAIITAKGLAPG